jgi:Outer membrane efflux protein
MNLAWCMIALAFTCTDGSGTTARAGVPSAAAVSSATLPATSKSCYSTCGAAPAPLAKAIEPVSQEIWPMTLRQAIAIALDNSEIVRVISLGDRGACTSLPNCFGPPTEPPPRPPLPAGVPDGVKNDGQSFVIARLNADASSFRFKSVVMAQVRSVEQQYWALAQAHVALWAADRAANIAHEVVTTEQDELIPCRAGIDYLAEASDHLKRFEQDLIVRTLDVIAAERALRSVLGLPESDNRRIIPVTPPTQARLEPDWETCLDAMMHEQPDVIEQKVLTRLAELQLLIARHSGLPHVNLNALCQMSALGELMESPEEALMSTFRDGLELGSPNKLKRLKARLARSSSGDTEVLELLSSEAGKTGKSSRTPPKSSRAPLANTRQAQYKLLRSRAFLKQVIHQTTHSLARGFLELDAGYKIYAHAKRSRIVAEKRLEAKRARWEEGRITSDRFLDAVEQYTAAVAAENQYLAAYNSATAFLSECKGTLLADDNIIVAECHARDDGPKTTERTRDDQTQKASFRPTVPQSRKPTFLELWQASTCPSLAPSFLALPDENACGAENSPDTED